MLDCGARGVIVARDADAYRIRLSRGREVARPRTGLAALLAVAASVAVEAFRRRAGHGRRGDSAGRGRPAAGPVSSSWDPAGARAPALVPPRSPVCEP